jgi:hypothetical protein
MRKLKLDLDEIQVLSFTVEMPEGSGGTVEARSPDTDVGCGHGTNDSCTCRFCLPMPISYDLNC